MTKGTAPRCIPKLARRLMESAADIYRSLGLSNAATRVMESAAEIYRSLSLSNAAIQEL